MCESSSTASGASRARYGRGTYSIGFPRARTMRFSRHELNLLCTEKSIGCSQSLEGSLPSHNHLAPTTLQSITSKPAEIMTRLVELASLLDQSTAEDFEQSTVCPCLRHVSKLSAKALERKRCYKNRCAPSSGVYPETGSQRMYSTPFVNGPNLGSRKRVRHRPSDRSSLINDAMKERVEARGRRVRTT